MAVVTLDGSPSTLIPFYDPDTSVVFLTGKVRAWVTRLLPLGLVPQLATSQSQLPLGRVGLGAGVSSILIRSPMTRRPFQKDWGGGSFSTLSERGVSQHEGYVPCAETV